jgi:hypothetical protein
VRYTIAQKRHRIIAFAACAVRVPGMAVLTPHTPQVHIGITFIKICWKFRYLFHRYASLSDKWFAQYGSVPYSPYAPYD